MDAHVMRDRDPGVCVQTMPFSGNTVRTHTQASLHALTRDAPFILIIINNIYIYISFFSEAARTPACTHFPQMRSVFAS